MIFDSPDGLVNVAEKDRVQASRLGWKQVTPEQAKSLYEKREAADSPVQAGAEGAIGGTMEGFGAIPRALAGAGEAVLGKNAASDTLKQINGENLLGALHATYNRFASPDQTQEEADRSDAEYLKDARARAEANPIASGAGKLAGTVAGFAPLGGLGAAAEGAIAPEGAGLAARLTGAAARGATEAGTLSLADATEEARQQDAALTAKQAIYSTGLGALFGGTLNLAGKAAGEFFSASKTARKAEALLAERRNMIPDLEPPRGPLAAPSREGVRMPPEIPDLRGEGPATIPAPPLPRESELAAEGNAKFNDSDLGRGIPSPRPAGVPESPTIPAPPTTNAEVMGLGGSSLSGLEPEPRPDLDVRGSEDFSKALRRESFEAAGRAKKVGKLLDAIPEGAHPDWVLKMSPAERGALAEMVGVNDPSDKTWRALADALADREGLSISPALDAVSEQAAAAAPSADDPLSLVRGLTDNRLDMTFVPKFVDAMGGDVAAAHDELEHLVSQGFIELRPESGLGRLSKKELGQLLPGPQGSQLSWIRLTDAGKQALAEEAAAAPAAASGDLEQQLRASLADRVGAPRNGMILPPELQSPAPPSINAPAPGTFQGPPRPEGPVPAFSTPPVGPQPAPGTPYQPPMGAAALIPPEEYGPALSQPVDPATPAGKAWIALGKRLAKFGARKMAGKAVGAMLGGSVGGLPGIALGMAAGHAVDKMFASSAMQRMAQKGVIGTTRAVEGALELGSRSASDGESPFFRAGKTPEAAYSANIKQLEALNVNNGRLLTDRIAKAFGPLTDPGAINAVTETARRGLEYLLAKVPVHGPDPGSLTPLSDAPVPSRSAIAEYADVSDTVLYPKTFEEAVKNGTVTAPMVDAMRAVHPEQYEQFQQDFGRALAARDAKDKPILGPERRAASTVLGIAQGIDSKEFANKYAQGFAELASSPQPKQKGASGRKLNGKSMFSEGASPFSTQTNQILSNP